MRHQDQVLTPFLDCPLEALKWWWHPHGGHSHVIFLALESTFLVFSTSEKTSVAHRAAADLKILRDLKYYSARDNECL